MIMKRLEIELKQVDNIDFKDVSSIVLFYFNVPAADPETNFRRGLGKYKWFAKSDLSN